MEEKKKNTIKKDVIIAGVIGLAVGIGATCLTGFLLNFFAKSSGIAKLKYGEDVVATVNGKGITASEIYEKLKKSQGYNILIDEIDRNILDEMYTLTKEEEDEVKEQAEYYISYYAQMGYTQESFLKSNGFATYDDFLNDIRLQMKSRKYVYDYLEKKLEDGAVKKYYDENKSEIETYDSEHVLVRITDTVTDEQALALINEILAKVNEGKTFDEIEAEYGAKIVHEQLGYQGKKANLEEPYLTALISMEDNSYSKEPVKTSYGYHIIHRKSTATFEQLRGTIIETLSQDLLKTDTYLTEKAFDELRKDKKLKIFDKDFKKTYQEYEDTINKTNPVVNNQ